MPAYNALPHVPAIYVQDSYAVWSAESPATNAASQQVAVSPDFESAFLQTISVEVVFSGDPGTFAIDVQTADTDTDAAYQSLPNNTGQISSVNSGFYNSLGLEIKAKFVRLFMTNDPSNSVTVTANITR